MTQRDKDLAYCRALVKSGSRVRFMTALFAPEWAQGPLFALYALVQELSALRGSVRDPAFGELRLQWWMETISDVYTGATLDHPIVRGLAEAVEGAGIALEDMHRLIEGYRSDLFDDPMESLEALEAWGGERQGGLLTMAARLFLRYGHASGEQRRVWEEGGYLEACRAGGRALGLLEVLEGVPRHRARGQCYVPRNLLEEKGLTVAHVLSGREVVVLAEIVKALADRALFWYGEARSFRSRLPKAALPAFLPLCLTKSRARKVKARALWVTREAIDLAPWYANCVILYSALRDAF